MKNVETIDDSEGHDEFAESESEQNSDHRCHLSLRAQVSAILFVSSRPIKLEKLRRTTGAKEEDLLEALAEISEIFQDHVHGFSLQEVADGFGFRSAPEAKPIIQKLIPARARRISRPAAETLAVIAYKQPVQKAEIEAIRGVDVLPTLKTLLDARLIRIVGRLESAGQPALYGTTETFLEKFGLKDLNELPTVRELDQLLSDPGEVQDEDDKIETEEFSELREQELS